MNDVHRDIYTSMPFTAHAQLALMLTTYNAVSEKAVKYSPILTPHK